MNRPVQHSTLPDIKSIRIGELVAELEKLGQPTFRADQIIKWVYQKCAEDWQEMTDLPLSLRQELAKRFRIRSLECISTLRSVDGTVKFLWRLSDGNLIESVLLPANPDETGKRSDRLTVCISTQVGCAWRCRFCASGMRGLKRNLEPHEIVEQVIGIEAWVRKNLELVFPSPKSLERNQSRFVDNVVVMGMGEPLDNYENVMAALKIINAPWALNIGARRITISTCGLVPEIRRLAHEPYQFELAVSLHAANDRVRTLLMPVNKKYPLSELISACVYYQHVKNRLLTFEYLLLRGVNDSIEDAHALAKLIRPVRCKVNVIPYNPVSGFKWQRPSDEAVEAFMKVLKSHRVNALLRHQKGADIEAACGQLRLRMEQKVD